MPEISPQYQNIQLNHLLHNKQEGCYNYSKYSND